MNIKRFITPLLLIMLLASMVAFGSSVPLGPYYDDTYFDLSSNALILKVVPHEKGGLEADVSAYDGLIKITGGATSNLTIGIADDNIVEIDDADAAVDDYCKLTANGIVGRSYTEVKTDLSLNYVENLKVKLDGTAAPVAATDDVTLGYAVGSRWFDITNDKEYVCLDNTDGAAVWTETTQSGGGGTFTGLSDTPANYTGQAGKYTKVNAGETALEFGTPAGAGDVVKVGTPVDSQVGVWTGDGTIEGAATLTYDGSNLQLTGDIGSTGTKITKGWFTDLTVTNAIAGSVTGNARGLVSVSNADITIQPNGTGDTVIYAPSDVVTAKTGTATLTIAEAGTVLVSAAGAAYTLTLPTASGHTGLRYHFVKTDYNYTLITLDGDGGETFNYENAAGSAQTTYPRLNTPLAEVTIVSDGTNW
ncbi:hypothetical protein KAX02_05685, partial [candidate division WOR-3 bacterium]|nr:hypothetical protein [candidate division WOR-3 bacterium]